TYDYTYRLLNFNLCDDAPQPVQQFLNEFNLEVPGEEVPTFEKVTDLLRSQGLLPRVPARETEPFDVTREKLAFPAPRSARLQILARGETGAMTALAYSSMRGY